jgi:hypothetical protein
VSIGVGRFLLERFEERPKVPEMPIAHETRMPRRPVEFQEINFQEIDRNSNHDQRKLGAKRWAARKEFRKQGQVQKRPKSKTDLEKWGDE